MRLSSTLLAACTVALLGDAAATVTLKPGTKLFHASNVETFSTTHRTATTTATSGDTSHPASPAWFAPISNPSLSVHVATWQGMVGWDGVTMDDLPSVTVYSYKTLKPLPLSEFATPQAARDSVKATVEGGGLSTAKFTADFQAGTAYHFCEETGALGRLHGYVVKADGVRGEKEYVLCKAHDPTFLKRTGKRTCVVRAKKRSGNQFDKPVLWVWCSAWINGGKWFKWDLNVDMNNNPRVKAARQGKPLIEGAAAAKLAAADVRMKNFKVAGIAERPWLKTNFSFREMLGAAKAKKTAAKALQPGLGEGADLSADEPVNEENKKHLTTPDKEEVDLLKAAAKELKEMMTLLRPETGL